MPAIVKFGLSLTIIFTFIFFAVDIMNEKNDRANNQDAISQSLKVAAQTSVQVGDLRVNERITLDEEIAEESLIRAYANNMVVSDNTVERIVRIPVIAPVVEEDEEVSLPLIGTEVYNISESLLRKYEERTNSAKKHSVQKNIIIYEAKCTDYNQGGCFD